MKDMLSVRQCTVDRHVGTLTVSRKRFTAKTYLILSKPISLELGYFYMASLLMVSTFFSSTITEFQNSLSDFSCTIYTAVFRNRAHASIEVKINKTGPSKKAQAIQNNIPPLSAQSSAVHRSVGLRFIL